MVRSGCIDGDVRTVGNVATLYGGVNREPVLASTKATPEIFFDGQWYPVCGHYFWDGSNNAATTLCQKLGFSSGAPTATRAVHSKHVMPLGLCKANEPLTSCTAGGNEWGNLNSTLYAETDYCHAGKAVGVTVTCTGGAGQNSSSCKTGVHLHHSTPDCEHVPLGFPCKRGRGACDQVHKVKNNAVCLL